MALEGVDTLPASDVITKCWMLQYESATEAMDDLKKATQNEGFQLNQNGEVELQDRDDDVLRVLERLHSE